MTGTSVAKKQLTATLFNRPSFTVDGRNLPINARKAEALLAYLCLCPGGRVARATAIGLLWGDKPEALARSSLRQIVLILNKAFRHVGFNGFLARKSDLALEPESVATDIDGILASIAGDNELHPRLQQRLTGDQLMESYDSIDDQFLVWLRVQRQSMHDRIRTELEHRLELTRDPGAKREVLQALLNVDPSHEPACRALMIDRASRGDQAGAVNEYNKLYEYLGEAFDSEPSGQTQDLLAEIKLDRLGPPAETAINAPAAPPAPTTSYKPRILIEEIEVSNPTGTSNFAAPVFRQDLISRLVRFREWSVVGVAAMPGDNPEIPFYRLRSSAVIAGERMKLSLNLQDFRTASYVWGDDYTLEIPSLFDQQTTIVSRIAAGINVHVSTVQLSRSATVAPLSLDNYHRWLNAQAHHFKHSPTHFRAAVEIYRHLIEEQPSFAPGYSSYAQTLNSRHLVHVGEARSPGTLEQARALSQTAQILDPFDSRSHLCAAWTAMLQGRFDEAEANLQLAYDLNENDPWTSISVAAGYALCGRSELARELSERALRLGFVMTPVQWGYLAALWFLTGEYPRAADAFGKAKGIYFSGEPWGIAALALSGDVGEAKRHCDALIRTASEHWTTSARPPRPAQIADWIAECFPIADADAQERLMTGLAAAGLRRS